MKKLVKIAAVLVLLLVVIVGVGVTILFMNANALAKRGIEAGGTYALGVPTKVDSVSLSIFGGSMSLSGLDVANPPGFKSPHFVAMKSGSAAVSLGSLEKSVIEVPKIALKGIDVNLERGGDGSNYNKVLDNLKKLKGSGPRASAPGNDKRFMIRELTIDDINVHAAMLGAPGAVGQALNSATKLDVPIEHIALTNIGSGSGVTTEELTSIITQAVLAAAAEKGGGILPADIVGDLKGAVSSLGGLADVGVNVVGKAGEAASQLGKAGEDAGKAINDIGKGITDGIGGLLGGKKDDKKEPPKKP